MAYGIELRTLEFVQAARRAGYRSDYALADAMDVNRSTISRVVNGSLRPGSAFIAGALTALGADFSDLFDVVHDTLTTPDPGPPT